MGWKEGGAMREVLDIEEEYDQVKATCQELQQEEQSRGKREEERRRGNGGARRREAPCGVCWTLRKSLF